MSKIEFPELECTPFGGEGKKNLYKDWFHYDKFSRWYFGELDKLGCKEEYKELCDVDEIALQWSIPADERLFNPYTCVPIYKGVCLVLRAISAEHEYAMKNYTIPGVVLSSIKNAYAVIIYKQNGREAVKTFDTEEEAFNEYIVNREFWLNNELEKAKYLGCVSDKVYDVIKQISIRSYSYYKERRDEYTEKTKTDLL